MWRLFVSLILAAAFAVAARAQMMEAVVSDTVLPAGGASQQVLSGITSAALSGTGVRYIGIGTGTSGATSDFPSVVFPVAGTLSVLRAKALTAPTGAATWTVAVNKNGTTQSLSCQINSTTDPCSDLADSVSVAAGDYVDLKSTPSGAPSNSVLTVSMVFTPTTNNDTVLFGYNVASTFANNATNAIPPFTANASPGSLAFRQTAYLPIGGTVDHLYAASPNTPPGTVGSGKSYQYEVYKTGVATALTGCTITDAGTTCNDSTNSASFAAADVIQFVAIPSGAPLAANTGIAVRFVPSTAGDFVMLGNQPQVNDSASATTYYSLTGANGADGTTTEANVQQISNSMTIVNLTVTLTGALSAGTKTFTLRDNGVSTGLSCSMTTPTTTCTATGTVSVSANDVLDVMDVPSGTPTVRGPLIGIVAHR